MTDSIQKEFDKTRIVVESPRNGQHLAESPLMVGLGEVLWDFLPSGRVLGGAPANFAYMATVLGNQGCIASSVGNDLLGKQARKTMGKLGLNTSYIQCDSQHKTGTAKILLGYGEQPTFSIEQPVAWDFLQWIQSWEELSSRANAVCFGSLAQRSQTSRDTIERFIQNVPANALRIFDANLREPFYSVEGLRRSFHYADILKLNEQELVDVTSLLGINGANAVELAKRVLCDFDLKLVCVTKGARGSLLISESEIVEHVGISVEVADSIGAGDAFTACVAHYYMRGFPLEEISESANRLAAWVATRVGATPLISQTQLFEILSAERFSEGQFRQPNVISR